MQRFAGEDIEVVPVDTLEQTLRLMFERGESRSASQAASGAKRLVAQGGASGDKLSLSGEGPAHAARFP
jgi:hypothetical protein